MPVQHASRRRDSVLVIGAGLSGLSAAETLLDAGLEVTVIDAFPAVGGRVASFEVSSAVAGLEPGDVVEHGLHGWFQHYHALYDLMARASLPKPAFAGNGVQFWNDDYGHFEIRGGPVLWLLNVLQLPERLRGSRSQALAAFARLIRELPEALHDPRLTDRDTAHAVLTRCSVPAAAIRNIFGPCLFSLTSLPLHELSALEMFGWLSRILPDPRISSIRGGGTAAMCAPIARYLEARGAHFRLGVEVRRLALGKDGRAKLELVQAPDRTGLRHVLVPGFEPAAPPNPDDFDAVVCTLPPDRLLAVSRDDAELSESEAWAGMRALTNIHPLTIRLWFERPIAHANDGYILSRGTLFDVLRAVPESGPELRLLDALVENMATHLPELPYTVERYIPPGEQERRITARVLADLERVFPEQIRSNRVLRRFLHTREGIIAARPGAWLQRPPQYVGSPHFVLAGDFTRHGYGVCMEGAVRSGQLAAASLLRGRQVECMPQPLAELRRSFDLFTALRGSPHLPKFLLPKLGKSGSKTGFV